MNESEIEKNLENYDFKNYKGIDEDRRKLHYSQKKMSFLGVAQDESMQNQAENVPENEEKQAASNNLKLLSNSPPHGTKDNVESNKLS